MAIAAHPGYARTNLFRNGPGDNSCCFRLSTWCCCFGQSAAHGALPILYAATSDDVQPSAYYGPRDCFELRGRVGSVYVPKLALDQDMAKKLWDVSAKLTKASWPDSLIAVGAEDAESGAGEKLKIF